MRFSRPKSASYFETVISPLFWPMEESKESGIGLLHFL
jgi:hypothetical protein